MTDWSLVFLGIIALATLVMALIQLGAIVMGVRLARRVNELTTEVQQEIRPLIAKLNAISDDAARVAATAVTQAERFDRTFGDITTRVDRAISVASHALLVPAREGIAFVSALRAVLAALRVANRRRHKRNGREAEDDALFIG